MQRGTTKQNKTKSYKGKRIRRSPVNVAGGGGWGADRKTRSHGKKSELCICTGTVKRSGKRKKKINK